MKTILVIYTHNKIKNVGYQKRYAFVTESDVSVGDMIESPEYTTPMQVVKVLKTPYKYFNKETGKLSNSFNNSNQFETRELDIRDKKSNVIPAYRLEE